MKKNNINKKIINKKNKGGTSQIPSVNTEIAGTISNITDLGINTLQEFMKRLQTENNNMLKQIETTGFINNKYRGGSKKVVNKNNINDNFINKKVINKKVVNKKVVNKNNINKKISNKKVINKKNGGGGSAWLSVHNSRGNVAAPDSYWGYPGELWFRQFNKTGEYIPNSVLPYATTPTFSSC